MIDTVGRACLDIHPGVSHPTAQVSQSTHDYAMAVGFKVPRQLFSRLLQADARRERCFVRLPGSFVLSRGGSFGLADHDDRAGAVSRALVGHRAEQERSKSTEATGADHDDISGLGCRDESSRGGRIHRMNAYSDPNPRVAR